MVHKIRPIVVLHSILFTKKYKAVWKENLALHQKSLTNTFFLHTPSSLKLEPLTSSQIQQAIPQILSLGRQFWEIGQEIFLKEPLRKKTLLFKFDKVKTYDLYVQSSFIYPLPHSVFNINYLFAFSKIQLVVYYQCCVLIGWATSRLYVTAH